jgi:hypothetical protein
MPPDPKGLGGDIKCRISQFWNQSGSKIGILVPRLEPKEKQKLKIK